MTGHDPLLICRKHDIFITHRRSSGCPLCLANCRLERQAAELQKLKDKIVVLTHELSRAEVSARVLRSRTKPAETQVVKLAPKILSLIVDLGTSSASSNGAYGRITDELFMLAGELVASVVEE